MKYYKVLSENQSYNGGNYTWSLPVRNADGSWTPGEWTKPVTGELEPCFNGYHLCRPQNLIRWLGPDIYEAEIDASGEMVEADDKIVVRSCRLVRKVEAWNERTARLFAVWCAREMLELIDNPDPRIVEAVDTAERYANGKATAFELHTAHNNARNAASEVITTIYHTWTGSAIRAAVWAATDATAEAAWGAAEAAWGEDWEAPTEYLLKMLGEEEEE